MAIEFTARFMTKGAERDINRFSKKASRDLNRIDKSATRLRQTTTGLTARIGALRNKMLLFSFATVATTVFLKRLVEESSKLKESINAVEVIFGSASKEVLEFGKTADRSAGLSASAFNQLVTVTGALIKGIGLPMKEVASLTIQLTQRAADMASVFDKDVSVALNAINSALRGQTEPITSFAVNTQIAALESIALAKGIDESVSAMSQQEKRLLVIDAIMQGTADTQGDFTNTQKSFANASRILTSRLQNMAAAIGDEMLPSLERFLDILNRITVEGGPLQKLGTKMQDVGIAFARANPFVKVYLDFLGVLKEKTDDAVDPMDTLLQNFIELNKEIDKHSGNVTDFIVESIVRQNKEILRGNILFGGTIKMLKAKNTLQDSDNKLSAIQLRLKVQTMGLTMDEFEFQSEIFELMANKNLLEEAANAIITKRLELVKVLTLEEGIRISAGREEKEIIKDITVEQQRALNLTRDLASAFGQAALFSNDLRESVKNIAKQLAVRAFVAFITSGLEGSGGFKKQFFGFAHGTNFAPGGPAIVGERGPEIVNLPRGSQVIPNNQINNNTSNSNISLNFPNVKTFDKFTVETQIMPLIREAISEGEIL